MAMIKCPECGNQISSRATACINCGLPMSEIFICPECANVMVKGNLAACTECGCPVEDNIEDIKNNTGTVKKEEYENDSEAKYTEIAESIIRTVLLKYPVTGTGILYESGRPISDRRKIEAVKIAFNIPKEDNVFFVVSGNTMSGINERCKGFAISSHGIFFCDDRRKKDYFLLHEFVNVKISKSMSFLRFGTYEFNVLPTGKIENLMFALQNEIAAHL